MKHNPLVSILINNFNYELYLDEAIESALNQTYRNVEVVVVDDGSTDDSVELLKQYGDKICLVTQKNQGQGAALNAGFSASTGDWILFLDADDMLDADSLRSLINVATGLPQVYAAIQFKLRCIDAHGCAITPERSNPQSFTDTDPLASLLREGSYCFAPTSGNLFRAEALREVMPVPVETYKICADLYIQTVMPFVGKIHFITDRNLGSYRIHGSNNFVTKEKEERKIMLKLERELELGAAKRRLIGVLSQKYGHAVSSSALKPGQSALLKQLVCNRSIVLPAEKKVDGSLILEMIYNVARRSFSLRNFMSNIRFCLFGIIISLVPRSRVGRLYCKMIGL